MPDHRRFRFPYLEDYLRAMADTPRSTFKRNYDSLRKVGRLYSPRIRGEATASYAALPEEVIREIATLNPEIKAILMIRDPLERAWSHARKDLLIEGQRADDLQTDALSRLLFKGEQRRPGAVSNVDRKLAQPLAAGPSFRRSVRRHCFRS